jgi:hypothetical protein
MLNAQEQHPAPADGLVYMVSGTDEEGDQHIFVTSDRRRAEAHHAIMLDRFTGVQANWLDDWG